jgi:predicted transcriptional regulator
MAEITDREAFILIISEQVFSDGTPSEERMNYLYRQSYPEDIVLKATNYWRAFLEGSEGSSATNIKITENGRKILLFMQENEEAMNNMFTSKEIAEAFFTSGRSIAGSMRKLVSDEFVSKEGKDPIRYSLTEVGRSLSLKT